jgi:hypothetical protein
LNIWWFNQGKKNRSTRAAIFVQAFALTVAIILVMLAVAIGMAATTVVVAVVATIIMATVVTTIVVIALVAHVVAQRATGAATCCGADQAAGGAAHAAADYVTAGCAQRTTDGGFATTAFVGANRTTTRAAQGCADSGTCIAA